MRGGAGLGVTHTPEVSPRRERAPCLVQGGLPTCSKVAGTPKGPPGTQELSCCHDDAHGVGALEGLPQAFSPLSPPRAFRGGPRGAVGF